MNATEKAKELIGQYYDLDQYNKTPIRYCKQCALVCVDRILSEYAVLQIETNFCFDMWKYWSEVRKEIEKL